MKLTELRLSSSLHGWDPLRIVAQILTLQAVHYIPVSYTHLTLPTKA